MEELSRDFLLEQAVAELGDILDGRPAQPAMPWVIRSPNWSSVRVSAGTARA